MSKSPPKSPQKHSTRTLPPGQFGMSYAICLSLLASVGIVSAYALKVSEAATLDYAVVFAGIVGVFSAVGLLAGGDVGLSRSRLTYAWTALMGWALLSAVLSGRPWASLVGETSSMLGLGMLAAMTAVALASERYARQIRRVIETFGWYVLLAESALVFVQLLSASTPSGTLPNSSYLGEAAVLLLPWTLGSADTPTWQRWPRIVTVVVTLAALAASGARVATVVGIAWAIWAIARDRSWSVRARTVGLLALIAVVASVGLFFAGNEILGSGNVSALGQRPALARIAVAAIALRPVVGWGPDGYRAGGSAASTVDLAGSGPMTVVGQGAGDPHDVLLWVAVSTGLVGLALFAWFGTETVLRWRMRLREGVDAWPAIWAIAVLAVVLLTEPAFPLVLPLAALVFGSSLWGPAPSGSTDSAASSLSRAVGVGVLALLALTSGLLALDGGVRSGLEDVGPASSPQLAAGALGAARTLSVDPHLWLLASRHISLASSGDPTMFPTGTGLVAIERAQALDGLDPDYPLQRALTLQSLQAPSAAVVAAYQQVFDRYPLQPQARAELAIYLARLGQPRDAEAQLKIARILLEKDPVNTAPLQGLVSQAEASIAAGTK